MDSVFLVLRLICAMLWVATLLWGLRMFRRHREHLAVNSAEASTSSSDTSGQRLYNTTQMVAVWLFFMLLFGFMAIIL